MTEHEIFINSGCIFLDSILITIGDRVLIAPVVKIYCGNLKTLAGGKGIEM